MFFNCCLSAAGLAGRNYSQRERLAAGMCLLLFCIALGLSPVILEKLNLCGGLTREKMLPTSLGVSFFIGVLMMASLFRQEPDSSSGKEKRQGLLQQKQEGAVEDRKKGVCVVC